jgi:hypothetical protein
MKPPVPYGTPVRLDTGGRFVVVDRERIRNRWWYTFRETEFGDLVNGHEERIAEILPRVDA